MTSSSDLIAAAGDADLRARLVALLAASGHQTPAGTVEQRIGQIVAQAISTQGQSIADVHAYTAARRAQAVAALPPAPGADPAAVTDAQLRAALTTLGLLPA